jgi:hypothetical protein
VDEVTYFDENSIAVQIDPGTVSGDVVWATPGYISILMNGSVTIAAGASLTVKPETVIKIAQNSMFAVDGKLIALGTEESPIFFTDLRDNTVGGEIPGAESPPEAGWWRSISIRNDGSAYFDWCRISYAVEPMVNDS